MENKKVLEGKRIYAFGDSIVYGHTLPEKSFMKIIAERNGVELDMYAVNGATVIAGTGNDIITQIKNAPGNIPDVIVFDGYTNDAYDGVLEKLGAISDSKNEEFDNSRFCGAFEELVCTMKKKWQRAKIVYVTIHKSAGRKWDLQCALREKAIEICKARGVEVVDVFDMAALDTRDDVQMASYIIDGAGSHPNEAACKEFYIPLVEKKLYELCK